METANKFGAVLKGFPEEMKGAASFCVKVKAGDRIKGMGKYCWGK